MRPFAMAPARADLEPMSAFARLSQETLQSEMSLQIKDMCSRPLPHGDVP